MLDALVRVGDDAAGIEKTLRLFQGFCTIAAGLSWSSIDAAPWTQARNQFALGRRYFRLLKWYPCWSTSYRLLLDSDTPPLVKALEVGKSSFLGLYFFLEMPTLTNTMRATDFSWGPTLVLEANKCWFYAIVLSLLISLSQLLAININAPVSESSAKQAQSSTTASSAEEKKALAEKESSASNPYPKIFRQLVIDGCDLIIAGATVGWIEADAVQVGVAYVISTSVAGRQIWRRIQSAPR